MKLVPVPTTFGMPQRRAGNLTSTPAATRPRSAVSARQWHAPRLCTMAYLGKGHGPAIKAIPANVARRLEEPST